MAKDKSKYTDKNLSKLYELEKQREKLCEIATDSMKNGKGLSSPEVLEQGKILQKLINEQMLDEYIKKENKKEKKKSNK